MTRLPRIVGVVFDLDGVIVDTEHLWEESWTAYCASQGRRWTPADTASVQGMSTPEWSRYVAELLGAPGTAEDARRSCVHYVIKAVADGHGPLLDGARELVTAVSDRVPIALASSSPRAGIDAVLAHHGLAERFSATVSSEEVDRGKPSPDVYAAAAAKIGIGAHDGLAIEDSANGIRAAHAAGLHVVAIPNPTYPPAPDALRLADHVAADHPAATGYVLSTLADRPL